MAYLSTVASSALDFQNFFSAKLTADLTATDTDVLMDTIPSVSEGVLVVDWDVSAKREVIFFNSKTASKVVCPSVANGRGFDGSAATTHTSGANVIMAPVADYFRYIKYIATTSTAAWKPLGYTPNTITDNGNRNYTLVFNSVDLTSFISNGMRLKGVRTTNSPTRCTSLNGTTQFYKNTTPAGTTFTDDFVAGAWVKLTSEPTASAYIISRYNGTSGWGIRVEPPSMGIMIVGYNGGAGNFSYALTATSIAQNKWVHVSGLLDMSAFTAASATAETAKSWIMFDGQEQPSTVSRAGTNPTTLAQAGELQVGAANSTQFFPGKIAQAFYSNTRITQANVRVIKNQGLTAALCTTHNIVSAYSFDNDINDINTGSANNLTAVASAVATTADSPFSQDDAGTPLGTTDFGLVMSRSFSTNTTLVVQLPEGCTLPTSGTLSSMSYSTEKIPYQFPAQKGRWRVESIVRKRLVGAIGAINQWSGLTAATGMWTPWVPIGDWIRGWQYSADLISSVSGIRQGVSGFVDTATSLTNAVYNYEGFAFHHEPSGTDGVMSVMREQKYSTSVAIAHNFVIQIVSASGSETFAVLGDFSHCVFYVDPANL